MVEVGVPLPNAAEAWIGPEKLHDYVLNPEHQGGGQHKARVFYAALGLTQQDWEHLQRQIYEEVQTRPVVEARPSYNGTRCSVVVWVEGANGEERPVMTGWRVPDDGSPPHLVTAYVAKGSSRLG